LQRRVEALIFIGIQGAGKTTFYDERFANTHTRISLDALRSRSRERAMLQRCLNTGQRFVVDNTNVRAADRAVYITAAKAAGFRVIGYFFEIGLRQALGRNARRSGKELVPVPAVAGTLKRLERPSPLEGFDELYVVSPGENGSFLVSPWPLEPACEQTSG